MNPQRVVTVPDQNLRQIVDRFLGEEVGAVHKIDSVEAQPLAGRLFKGQRSIRRGLHIAVLTGRSVEQEREIQRTAHDRLAGVIEPFPRHILLDDHRGVILGTKPDRPVGERDSRHHPDRSRSSHAEPQRNRPRLFQRKTRSVKSDLRHRILALPGNRGIFPAIGSPPVAAVDNRPDRNLLHRTVGILGNQHAKLRAEFRRPAGGVQKIDSARIVPRKRQFDFGSDKTALGFRHNQRRLPVVFRRIDNIEGDGIHGQPAGFETAQIVVRPLVGPAALAVTGDFVGKAEIRRRRQRNRQRLTPVHLEIDFEGGLVKHTGIRRHVDPDRMVHPAETRIVLNHEFERIPGNRDLVTAARVKLQLLRLVVAVDMGRVLPRRQLHIFAVHHDSGQKRGQ